MAIFETYLSRQQKLRSEGADVYSYGPLPGPLKVQIVHIWDDVLGDGVACRTEHGPGEAYTLMVSTLRREFGVFRLDGVGPNLSMYGEWRGAFLATSDIDIELTMVELAARMIERFASKRAYRLSVQNAAGVSKDAIEELNQRLRQHCLGYQYVDSEILRVDSELVHAEVVKPALALLRDPSYQGAQQEFLKAHEHYRHGDTKAALTEALKAIESVMQTICQKRDWDFDPKATSKTLIGILFDKGLIPAYWQSHFGGLRTNLESGVPTARNREGGHGQGAVITSVPPHLAAYVLHQTAAAIVFLVEAERAGTGS